MFWSNRSFVRKFWLGCLLTSVLPITACQSLTLSDKAKTGQTIKTPNNQQAFLIYEQKSAVKSDFVKALQAHLASERVVLTDYYNQHRLLEKHPLDTGDDLLSSLLKTYLYKTAQDEEGEDDGLLRYYDTLETSKPDLDETSLISKQLSGSLAYGNQQVYRLASNYRACVTEYSYDVDAQLLDNPALTSDNPLFIKRQQRFANCLDDVKKRHQGIDDDATAYQQHDLALIRQCASTYQTNLKQALDKHRTIKRYEGADFDVYQSIYGHFAICYANFEMGYRLEPINSQEEPLSKKAKQMTYETLLCATTATDTQAQLQKQGKTYANDPKAYETAFYEYFGCLGGKYGKVYDNTDGTPIASPTTFADAQEAFDLHQELLAMDEETDDTPKQSLLSAYFAMKNQTTFGLSKSNDPIFDTLKSLQITPKQAIAYNLYYVNNAKMTTLSHHKPKDKVVSSVLAMDFEAPAAEYRLRLPFLADFDKGVITADMSPVLLAGAILEPKQTPILNQQIGTMTLPKEWQAIPMSLIYDSVQTGYYKGLLALDEAVFSQVVAQSAPFANQFNADKIIKVQFDSKQAGQLLGVIIKQLQNDLSDYINQNPQKFEANEANTQKLKKILERWAMLNDGYHIADMGKALQLVEAVLPMEWLGEQYYYLKAGQLVGRVGKTKIKHTMAGVQDEMLMVASYHSPSFKHPLTNYLVKPQQSAFDVNAWWLDIKQYKQAQTARQSYVTDEMADDETGDNKTSDDGVESK